MEMKIVFPEKKKVCAEFDGFTVVTDQPVEDGGDGSAPAPFDLFLASLGTCAGFFISAFCQKRSISMEGIRVRQEAEWDNLKHLVSKITLEIELPAAFPEKYRDSLVNAVNLCTVKRHLQQPPQFDVITKPSGP